MYTAEQVKAICLAFYEYLPKNPAHHNESIFDAWFEAYGDKIARRTYEPSMETNDTITPVSQGKT